MQFYEDENVKKVKSPFYNYYFRKSDGFFARWGAKKEDNPQFSPFGNEILDIEITTICNGVKPVEGAAHPCRFCYKSNTPNGKNMSFDTFKAVLDKLPNVKDK